MLAPKSDEVIRLEKEKQADWRDDTDDELEDQELEAHYMYMAQLQQVSPDVADSGPIFDDEPLQKVSNADHYNVFAMENVHPGQSKSVHNTYHIEQDAQNVKIDSLDMSYDREEIDQNDDDNDLAKERELLASLIEKLKCEIDESKNRNKFLETSNKILIEKLKGEIEDFKNKSLESSNNFFKEANNRLSETNNLLYADYKKSEAKLARRNSKEYASEMELECAKEMVADLRYFNSLELEVDYLISQLETQKTQYLNEIDRLSKEYYYADHMNAILGVYTELDELVEIVLFIIDSGCSKHMTRNLKLLINFVEKFLGLNHNLFSVGQFCDADLEVAFPKSMCYIRDLKGNKLLTATSSQAWLWHRRLSYLNFDTSNLPSKNDIVVGLPKLKFVKDHLCSSLRIVQTDKGSEFLNKTLHTYFAAEGIPHQTSVARTPEQNGIVERRNRTLVEAA
nr:hypothetical protein [Tanacetum cinerariifolium]